MIVGRLIPAGTGLAFHEERQRKQTADIDAAFITEEEARAELADVSTVDLDDSEMPAEIIEVVDEAEAKQPEQDA